MKCMKQEEMHEFVEDMCDVYDKNMEKEGEFGNDMKGDKPEGDYGYGDNKPEGEGEKGGYRKRRSCNGGPPEQCPGYNADDEEEDEHSHDDMEMEGSGNKMDGEMKMQMWTQCTMKCGQKKMMAGQMCMDVKSEMMSEMMGGSGMGMDDMKPE